MWRLHIIRHKRTSFTSNSIDRIKYCFPQYSGRFYRWRNSGTSLSATFAYAREVSLNSNVNVIVATLQLQQVQSLLRAIHRADAQSIRHNGSASNRCDEFCRDTITPTPRYLPRPIVHPTPRYLPRPVVHPTPKINSEPTPHIYHKANIPHIIAAPQPPWKVLPWEEPNPPANVIKVQMRPSDIIGKGNLIDLFV